MGNLIYLLMFLPDVFDNLISEDFNIGNFMKYLKQYSLKTHNIKRLSSSFSNNEELRIRTDEIKDQLNELMNDKSELINKLDNYTREGLYHIQNLPKDGFFKRVKSFLSTGNLGGLLVNPEKFSNDRIKKEIQDNINSYQKEIKTIDSKIESLSKDADDYRAKVFKLGPTAYLKNKMKRLEVTNLKGDENGK